MRPTLALALTAAFVVACGGEADPGPDATPVVPNSPASVREVATKIYDEVAAGGEVATYMEAVMLALGVRAETDPATLDARVAARLPAFMTPQTLDLAAAFAHDNYLVLDDFLAALVDHGIHRSDGGPLDRAFLDARFAEVATLTSYGPDEVLPALVLALASARTARYGGATDPLWGDGLLDPLQSTLLLYALGAEVSGVSAPGPAPRRQRDRIGGIFDFTIERLKGQAETKVMDQIEWPLGVDDLAQSAPCVSLALYGHKLTVTNTPDRIYHHQVDVASPPPFRSMVATELTFLDDYWDNYPQTKGWLATTLIGLAGCKFPRQGTVPGKPLTWSVGHGLDGHGGFDFAQSVTGGDGEGFGVYTTVAEITPMMHRTQANLRIAFDWVTVRAGNLVPGWNTLALVVGGLKRLPDTGTAYLAVRYYKNPCATRAHLPVDQCIDEWYGDAEATSNFPDGTRQKVTATGLTWRATVTGDGTTLYNIVSGTVSYELTDPECTFSFNPTTVDSWGPPGSGSGNLTVRWGANPVTYSGNGSMAWTAQATAVCPDGTNTIPMTIGGQFFRAADSTPPMGAVLAGNYTLMGTHYVYSFHR